MNKTLKIASLLLTYPEPGWLQAVPGFESALAEEGLLSQPTRERIVALARHLEADPLAAQEAYVGLFDQTRSLSLHLFEHVHGVSRDRGQAMVDLGELYATHGLSIERHELPDYLPLFLEFLAVLSDDAARETLNEALHVIAALGERLKRRDSRYAVVFEAIVEFAGTVVPREEIEPLLAVPDDDPSDLAALDAAWEAEEVTFGGGQAACGTDRLRQRVRAANREAPSLKPQEGGRHV